MSQAIHQSNQLNEANESESSQRKTLWLDLGNTRLKYWLKQGEIILNTGAELHLQSPTDLLLGLIGQFHTFDVTAVYISSVLNKENNTKVTKILKALNCPIFFAQVKKTFQQSSVKLNTLYDENLLGIDRWLQILALSTPNTKKVVVGCGTALTVDVLENETHLGGYIVPSLYLQRDALIQGTRQIKVAENPFTETSLGIQTSDAVHHGILFGVVGLLEKLARDYPEHAWIMTGGDALLLRELLPFNTKIDYIPQLLLQGLTRYFEAT